ncbi:GNAT family N-acetyltransferase, partial [Fulvivirga sp. RKSG066]|uniref:GNAT family N-acetyltransferase n=1 Tax=Fulvivirga aurantia TaxID=2529383 RepID=UPI0012BD5E50
MKIRPAIENDIPSIVELLKSSLGESLMPKSEAYWRWKHIDNPFGTSPVLVAEREHKIIAVRAFMRWDWQYNSSQIKAIRAVDTATHPDFQGQGLFKKLTLTLLEQCKNDGIDIIFNTPNSKSKPGYLKMGWQEVGKLPIQLRLKRPFSVLKNKFITKPTVFVELETDAFDLQVALDKFDGSFHSSQGWNTSHSKDYLVWRYVNLPMIKYYGYATKDSLVIFRLKQGELGLELRLCDCLGFFDQFGSMIRDLYKKVDFDYMSLSGLGAVKLSGLLSKGL